MVASAYGTIGCKKVYGNAGAAGELRTCKLPLLFSGRGIFSSIDFACFSLDMILLAN